MMERGVTSRVSSRVMVLVDGVEYRKLEYLLSRLLLLMQWEVR